MKIVLFTFILLFTDVCSQVIELDTAIAQEKLNNPIEVLTLNSQKEIVQNLKELPNTSVIGELSGHPFELVIDGVHGFRHNYSIWGVPINFEATSSTDLSLLGDGRYSNVDINFTNKYMSKAVGSNIDFTPKIKGDNILLLRAKTNQNYSALFSYYFPPKVEDFDMRATIDFNIYKNEYFFCDNNGTLYNTNDDKVVEYSDGYSQNFHATLAQTIGTLHLLEDFSIINRSVAMQNAYTKDPTQRVLNFMVLLNYNKIIGESIVYTQNFMINHNSTRVIDTTLAIKYNMGQASVTTNKSTKASLPTSIEKFFDISRVSFNILPSYDVSLSDDEISENILSNSKRFRINESVEYFLELNHLDISATAINSNRLDNFEGTYAIYNDTTKYKQSKEASFDFNINATAKLGINKLSLEASSATRFPSLYELFGDNLFVISNPNLESEKSIIKLCAKYGFAINNFALQTQYQFNKIENLITSNLYDHKAIKFFNTDKANITTLSLNANYNYGFLDNVLPFEASFNIAYNYAINKSEGNLYGYKVANIHPLTAKLLGNISFKAFSLSVNSFYYSKLYTNKENRTYQMPSGNNLSYNGNYGYLPEHIKIDMALSYLNNYFKLVLGAENITDKQVSLSSHYINQGRLFSLTISKTF